MQATRKATVRFRERSELLDFLLEVSAATSQTLDLDQLLANVARDHSKGDCRTICSRSCSINEKRAGPAHPLRRRTSGRGGPQSLDRARRRRHRDGGRAARADSRGRRPHRSAVSERGGRGAHGTGRADDCARQAGRRDRPAIDARQRLYRIRPRAAAADRGARERSRSTTRASTAAWSGRTAL